MSHPRHSQFDDPAEDEREASSLALQLAAARHHAYGAGAGGMPPPPRGTGPGPGGHHPPHPHAVPIMPGRGGHLPPGHYGHGPPHGHHLHHPHHNHMPPHMMSSQPPPPSAVAPSGPGGFLHPSAFNSGLAAAIAAAEYQKQREASAAAHVFAAAHANGVQPFLPGFPGSYHPGHPHHPGHPPPHSFGRGVGLPPGALLGHPGPGGGPSPLPPGAFLMAHPGMSPSPMAMAQHRPGSNLPVISGPGVPPGSRSPHTSNSSTPNPPHHDSSNKRNNAPVVIPPRMPIFSNGRPELPPPQWYDASVPLGVMEDKYYLSELQCVLRSEFVEAFGTTQTDIVLPVHGRHKPIALGQVGIRCQHCKDVSTLRSRPSDDNEQRTAILPRVHCQNNAISYPSFISGIYNIVQQMYRLHFDACPYIPDELKERVRNLKDSHTSNRGGRKQYWIDSAKRIGLVDTSFGIHYGCDPEGPLPPLGGGGSGVGRRGSATSLSVGGEDEYGEFGIVRGTSHGSDGSFEGVDAHITSSGPIIIPMEDIEIYPLVLPDDKPLISDYLYLALEQMQPCNLMDADRVGCYKGRRTGFPGLACRHCIGQAGCGRYFPASEASLSQTTTSQTIVNHVRNCRRCPMEIREQLELMKRAKTCPEYKKSDKPKHGGRKVFFHRLWCRIQRIPLPDAETSSPPHALGEEGTGKESPSPSTTSGDKESMTSPKSPERKKRKTSADLSEKEGRKSVRRPSKIDFAEDDNSDADEKEALDTVEFDNVHNNNNTNNEASSSPERERATESATLANNENARITYQGRTRLTRDDDPHWLSEADCFIRQELAEVFTAQEEDTELFGEPEIGQVGIRCFYCAENKDARARTRGHVFFPSNVGGVQQAVSDLQRRHLGVCKEIPEDIRKSFQSMKGYGNKPKGDTAQYWMDAAKELGLHDSHEGQGISFFRNPLDNSPADELGIEKNENEATGSVLVPPEDRSKCTDHMLLLLKQFESCQFRTSDRKSSRSRDRALGFPGLVCIHCKEKRYFPMTEKKLQDSLSLMTTHINNCFQAPLDAKASICYLYHRSLLQKQELPGQWKFTFFKGVWNRLHQNHGATESAAGADADASSSTAAGPATDSDGKEDANKALPEDEEEDEEDDYADENGGGDSMEEEEVDARDNGVTAYHGALHDEAVEPREDGTEVKEMKDLVKAAALWLSERDAEYEARGVGCGRGRGIKRR